MSDKRITPAQEKFLRLYIANPQGLQPEQWPSPVIFRRWLRRPTFRKAFEELRDAHRFTADLQLASASSRAAAVLNYELSNPIPDTPLDYRILLQTIRLANLRQRLDPKSPKDDKRPLPDLEKERPESFADFCIARARAVLEVRRRRAITGLSFDFDDEKNKELLPEPPFSSEIHDWPKYVGKNGQRL